MQFYQWDVSNQSSMTINGLDLETACFGPTPAEAPTIVLLHEGLGCTALWRSFPQTLSQRTNCGVFAWSRAGYGGSDPVALPRPLDYMTQEATTVQIILDALQVDKSVLLGHSDGASIATIFAGSVQDHRVRGLILIAPHFFVEPVSIEAIRKAKASYDSGVLKEKLSAYHKDVDVAFNGWSNAWLAEDFLHWDISDNIDYLRVPVLALQGVDDPYGTLAQLETLDRQCYSPVEKVILSDCKHTPHLEKTEDALQAIESFLNRLWKMEGVF